MYIVHIKDIGMIFRVWGPKPTNHKLINTHANIHADIQGTSCMHLCKVLWSVLSLANNTTAILHSYISSLPILLMAATYTPLYLLHVLDTYHVRILVTILFTFHITKITKVTVGYPQSETSDLEGTGMSAIYYIVGIPK